MSCEVAALPFQARANYGTLCIDFKFIRQPKNNFVMLNLKCRKIYASIIEY